MPIPKEILESIREDIDDATLALADLKSIVSDMRFAGMDTTRQDAEIAHLTEEIRKLRIFHDRQKAKA